MNIFSAILTNFGTHLGSFSSLEEAVAAAKRAGFETTIVSGPKTWAWSPISGLRRIT